MDWLKNRFKEPTSYVGLVSFLLALAVQLFPELKNILTPEFGNAITLLLGTLGGILFGKTAPKSPDGPTPEVK